MRDEHVVGTPRVHRLSLSATGTPASGPGSSPAATLLVHPAGRRSCGVGHDGVEGVDVRRRRRRWPRGGPSTTLAAERSPVRTAAAMAAAVPGALTSPPRARRHPEAVVLDRGRHRQHLGPVEARADHVLPQHVDEREGVAGRRHPLGVERLHVLGVVEHGGQLDGEQVELLVGERQAGEVGHVGDVVAGDALGHAGIVEAGRGVPTAAGGPARPAGVRRR
jgi:hypothetical protein